MSTKIDLPDGEWASLRDPLKVSERLRRPLVRLKERLSVSDMATVYLGMEGVDIDTLDPAAAIEMFRPAILSEDADQLAVIDDLVIVALVDEWSFDLPITTDSAQDIPGDARDAILTACQPLVGPLTGQVTEAEVLDPNSPSQPPSD